MTPKFRAALLPFWATASLQLVLVPAQAQTQTAPSAQSAPSATPQMAGATGTRADPADPKAPVPTTSYVSPLRAYQGFAEPQVAPWRETNELVRQRGGWRAYAREAREADAAPTAAPTASRPAPAAKPTPGGHSGHGMN